VLPRASCYSAHMAEPRFIGWYHKHPIRIYKDGDERPRRVVFEPTSLVDGSGNPCGEIQYEEERERSLEGAQNTALALAQNLHFRDRLPIQEAIEWRKLRDD
jgi:hypothetical protein